MLVYWLVLQVNQSATVEPLHHSEDPFLNSGSRYIYSHLNYSLHPASSTKAHMPSTLSLINPLTQPITSKHASLNFCANTPPEQTSPEPNLPNTSPSHTSPQNHYQTPHHNRNKHGHLAITPRMPARTATTPTQTFLPPSYRNSTTPPPPQPPHPHPHNRHPQTRPQYSPHQAPSPQPHTPQRRKHLNLRPQSL